MRGDLGLKVCDGVTQNLPVVMFFSAVRDPFASRTTDLSDLHMGVLQNYTVQDNPVGTRKHTLTSRHNSAQISLGLALTRGD